MNYISKLEDYGDHPRMCGDHLDQLPYEKMVMGSPPHVRGPREREICSLYCLGITPACAGTTVSVYTRYIPGWDHPRMCGDHSFSIYSIYTRMGSPPHVRGPL